MEYLDRQLEHSSLSPSCQVVNLALYLLAYTPISGYIVFTQSAVIQISSVDHKQYTEGLDHRAECRNHTIWPYGHICTGAVTIPLVMKLIFKWPYLMWAVCHTQSHNYG